MDVFAISPQQLWKDAEADIRAGQRARMEHRLAAATDRAADPVAEDTTPGLQFINTTAGGGNELRPESWSEIIGQDHAKALLYRMIETCKKRHQPLDHILFVGPSGTGKTTFAHVIAHELGARVYQLEAPISADTLMELAGVMQDGDILFLDEIHQQAVGDRRGRQSSTQPEILFSIMEDFTMPTGNGVIRFPRITVMGATTDEGALPDAFVNRFPIRPRLVRYSHEEMVEIVKMSMTKKHLAATHIAANTLARASRGIPREVNNFVRNAASLTDQIVTPQLATEIIRELHSYTEDGLTPDMQEMLKFLYTRGKRITKDGVAYQASVGSIATGIGKSRDVKAIQLRVEPYLIEQGYVQVLHGGRALTDAGVQRATELLED